MKARGFEIKSSHWLHAGLAFPVKKS
jgi:hypothetical protein